LERHDRVGEGEDGIVRAVRIGSVAAISLYDDAEVIAGGVHRTGIDAHCAPGDLRVDVRRHDRRGGERALAQDQVRPEG
jgi:hypothetical protein